MSMGNDSPRQTPITVNAKTTLLVPKLICLSTPTNPTMFCETFSVYSPKLGVKDNFMKFEVEVMFV